MRNTVLRVLVDTNVLLDYILCREPHADAARSIVLACKERRIDGCIAAHSISNMFFILRKAFSVDERRILLTNICELFYVEGIDKQKVIDALANHNFDDFEDCLQLKCAEAFQADYIVTRNIADFKGSHIPCLEPIQFCELL